MRNKLKLAILALAVGGFTTACQSEYDIIENGVYLTDAQSAQAKRVTIDDKGVSTQVSVRLGAPVEQNVTVSYGCDATALQAYNAKNGVDYQLLPEKYYSFSEAQATIKAGEVSSAPVDLIIKPFDEGVDVTKKYAIPVSIVSASGADVLQASSSLMILIDQVIITTVPNINNGNYILADIKDRPLMGISSFTIEANVLGTGIGRDNLTAFRLADINNKNILYTRFIAKKTMEVILAEITKPQSIMTFTDNKWYHLAITYDGINIRYYVDGKLDFVVPHANPGQIFDIYSILFANNVKPQYCINGKVSELRFWSVARSQSEIESNMYVVSPDSPGLEVYWKCNEGSGTVIKDYSNHGRDGQLKMETTWEEGVRFPDTEE